MSGILSFLIIMIVWYMTFGTAFYIVNLSRVTEDGKFIDDITGIWFIDAFESQYELGLGEFKLDNYNNDGSYQVKLCYILFIGSTFLIMIVFLNMLIAIMGDTYAQVSSEANSNARITKLEIMEDYIHLINQDKEDTRRSTRLLDRDTADQTPWYRPCPWIWQNFTRDNDQTSKSELQCTTCD